MKHLVKLADLEPRQHEEVVTLLRRHGIAFRETPAGVLWGGAIEVAEDLFPKAQAILREEACEFAARARAQWEEEWRTEHRGSGAQWFINQLYRRPGGTIVRLVLLVAMVSIFVVYPVWYVIRG